MRIYKAIAVIMGLLVGMCAAKAQTLELGPDTALCNYVPLVLDAGPGFVDYQWSTGSSAQTIVANATGEYKVTVTDTSNNSFVDSIHVTLYPAPIAVFLANNVCLGTPTPYYNLSQSSDSVVSWFWNFNDGHTDTAFQPTHIFGTSGIKSTFLQVTTIHGCIDTVTNPLEVFGLPFVDAGPNDSINLGDTVQLHASTNVHNFHWEPADYVLDTSLLNPFAVPQYTTLFTVTATDSLGCTNIDSVTIYVNQAPVAGDIIVSISSDGSGVVDVQQSDSDPNGDQLTTTIVSGPFHGTATVLNGDSIAYAPNSHYTGIDTIIYRVCDMGNPPLCAQATIYIYVSNVPPYADNDSLETIVNTSATINVLANDSDINEQLLTISEIGAPQHGTITDGGNGILTYTPAEGYSGSDGFYYLLCNNGSPILCDTGWVIINVLRNDLKVSNSFSPNGDGVVDKFVIEGITAYPDNHLLIFSRWGDKVYEKTGYNNDWDGKKGFNEDAPDGIYFYQLDLGDGSKPLTGWIMLKR